uniref:Uncharacterized protein n=1 Tax=Anopheles melas TaxID=34690 RepID=A0A182U2A6_9DIPT
MLRCVHPQVSEAFGRRDEGVAGRKCDEAVPPSILGKDSSENTIAFIGTCFSDIEDDGTPAPEDADAAPVDDDVAAAADAVLPFTVLTRSWSWQCTRCSAAGSYGTEVPVSISSLQTAMVESLVALVAVFAAELAVCDDFFLLLRLVR